MSDYPEAAPRHGVDGWQLLSYRWKEGTGEGVFLYRHRALGEREVVRPQPTLPDHVGYARN